MWWHFHVISRLLHFHSKAFWPIPKVEHIQRQMAAFLFLFSLSLSVKISVYVWRFSGMSNLEWLATVTMMDIDEQCVLELVPMRCGTHPMHQHLPFLCLSSPQLWVEQMESFQVCIGVPVNIEFSWVAKNVFEMSEHSGTEIEWNWLEGVSFSFCLAKCFPAQDVKIMKLVDHHGTV